MNRLHRRVFVSVFSVAVMTLSPCLVACGEDANITHDAPVSDTDSNADYTAVPSGGVICISDYYAGFNGRSTEGPSWTNSDFIAAVKWMSPQSVRYPGGTQGNSWDWRTGGLMGKNTSYPFRISDFVAGLPTQTEIIYMMNMVCPTPATGYSGKEPENVLKSDEVLQAKINDMLDALTEFKRCGKLPIAIELGNELYFSNEHAGIYGANPSLYLDHALIISRAIKQKYPNMHILLCTTKGGTSGRDRWNDTVYSRLSKDEELKRYVRGVVQHHYITESYGSVADIDTNEKSTEAIAEGFSYVKSVKSDYDNVPIGLKLWITEYGLSKRKEECGKWCIGLQYLAMSLGWFEWGEKIENIQCQHITLDPGVINKVNNSLGAVGIAYGSLMQVLNGKNHAQKISFTTNQEKGNSDNACLYGWRFTNDKGGISVLIMNFGSSRVGDIDLTELFPSKSVPEIKQYWSETPYSEVFIGRGVDTIHIRRSKLDARPFSLSIITKK